MQHAEQFIGENRREIAEDPMSAAVIGIKDGKAIFFSTESMERRLSDWKNQRLRQRFWEYLKFIADILADRDLRQAV
jgi:6-phosphofructokinase 1